MTTTNRQWSAKAKEVQRGGLRMVSHTGWRNNRQRSETRIFLRGREKAESPEPNLTKKIIAIQ